jgi:hypothetical protein
MITPAFTIKMDEADLAKVLTMCEGLKNAAGKVTVRALNKTLAGVKTDASSAIRAEITASKSAVDGTFKTEKATTTRVRAAIASTGKPLPLIEYSAKQTKKGVSVQVKRARPRKVIAGAFIADLKSGHKGAFWREWHGQKKQAKQNLPYGKLPRKYRLPIKQLYGPRVPDIMSNDPVMKIILAQADERLHKNLMHELEYELSLHK